MTQPYSNRPLKSMNQDNKQLLVYLGCGNHRMKDFIHVEISLWKHKGGVPDVLADITEYIPFPDSSVDLVYSRATMEHLTYTELLNCLLETRRILKKGGHIRMVLPDLDIAVRNYLNKIYDSTIVATPDMPNENYSDTFITQITYSDHFYNHNFDTISRALSKCGFEEIRRCQPGDSKIASANEELFKAEQGRNDDMIVEALKLDAIPSATHTPRRWPKSFLARFMAKYFNIRIAPYVDRAAKFPQKYWFKGLFFNRIRRLRKKFPWNLF